MSMSNIVANESLFSVARPRRRLFRAFVLLFLVLILSSCQPPEEILEFHHVHVIGCRASRDFRFITFLDALGQVQGIWAMSACDTWNASTYWDFTVRGHNLIQAGAYQ